MGEVLAEFDRQVGTRVVARHNIKNFDLKLQKMGRSPQHGLDVQSDYYIDTMKIMRQLHPEPLRHKLKNCGDYYGR